LGYVHSACARVCDGQALGRRATDRDIPKAEGSRARCEHACAGILGLGAHRFGISCITCATGEPENRSDGYQRADRCQGAAVGPGSTAVSGNRIMVATILILCVLSHGTHSLGSAQMSYLLDRGTKKGQGSSPVHAEQRAPVLQRPKLLDRPGRKF
jgi:hypothetical protein